LSAWTYYDTAEKEIQFDLGGCQGLGGVPPEWEIKEVDVDYFSNLIIIIK
jgi:hypothetical protein